MEHIDALSLESRFKRLRDALTEFAQQVLPEVAMNTVGSLINQSLNVWNNVIKVIKPTCLNPGK